MDFDDSVLQRPAGSAASHPPCGTSWIPDGRGRDRAAAEDQRGAVLIEARGANLMMTISEADALRIAREDVRTPAPDILVLGDTNTR